MCNTLKRQGEEKFRKGEQVLKLRKGDLLDVFGEEADDVSEGGKGWLLGCNLRTEEVGWTRTETLYTVE